MIGGQQWMAQGACAEADPDLWFSDRVADVRAAQRVCGSCPVEQQCREHAIAEGPGFGVWGGLTAAEIRAARAPAVAAMSTDGAERMAAYLALPSGLSNRQAADRLGVSPRTIQRYHDAVLAQAEAELEDDLELGA